MISVHDQLRAHLLASCGYTERACPLTPDPAVAGRVNWSIPFVTLMKNRMLMGYYRYGTHVALGPRSSGATYDSVTSAIERLRLYRRTGNQEHLVDAANLCMVEFCTPTAHRHPHFRPVDDGVHTRALKE